MNHTKKIISAILSLIILTMSLSVSFSVFAQENNLEITSLTSYCNLTSKPVLRWEKVDGATGYKIYKSTEKYGEYSKIATVKANSYTDEKAKAKKSYYYKIRAYKSSESAVIHSDFSNIVKQKALKTVLVGDSIMHGVKSFKGLPNGDFITKIGVGPNSFYNYAFSEYKINGKTSKGVDKVISSDADRIFIMLGMNEINWNSTKNTISNYRKVLNKIKKKLPKAEIIVLATSPTAEKRVKGVPSIKKVNTYNKEVKKLCGELDIEYYDYTKSFKDSNGYLKSKYNGGDGCHWNKSGAKQFVKELKKYVKNN